MREDSIRPISNASRFRGLSEKDDFSYCANTESETRKAFLMGEFESELKKLPEERIPPPSDPREDKIRRDLYDKKAKKEFELAYDKNKIEQEKELEKKKREFASSISKKSFTFDYSGKIMYLKPQREDNIAINEFTEIKVNKKNVKPSNPPESTAKVRIVEITEREGGGATGFGGGSAGAEEQKKKAPKLVGMFRPAPPVMDVIHVEGGVTISMGKNQVKKGVPIKAEKLRFDEFKEKHRGELPKDLQENSEEKRKREEELKGKKEKKYRRTIDNWKEELKKGLKDHLDFDPELLINLIMTDDLEANRERKIKRRVERDKKIQDSVELRKKLEDIIRHPEQFLNRVAVYRGDNGEENKKLVVDEKLVNEFQKAVIQFNERLVTQKPQAREEEMMMHQLPVTEMDAEKYKFTRPKQMNHHNLILMAVGKLLLISLHVSAK